MEKKSISYTYTNEELFAILKGLDLKKDDNVLAIAGSGDQAFAMLPYVDKITAVDVNTNQIDYIEQRMRWLKEGNKDYFLERDLRKIPSCPFQNSLNDCPEFSRREKLLGKRLEGIIKNLERLSLVGGQDIKNLSNKESFTKIYLSNILEWYYCNGDSFSLLKNLTDSLKKGGLIYFADGENSWDEKDPTIPKELILEKTLTSIAREYERKYGWKVLINQQRWYPSVYKKVSD
jgi:SAM-dependent methyltransferase